MKNKILALVLLDNLMYPSQDQGCPNDALSQRRETEASKHATSLKHHFLSFGKT